MLPIVSTPSSNSITSTATRSTDARFARLRGYGYAENEGIARRQHRALTLLTQHHVTPLDLTLNGVGCPIVIRFRVQSESDHGHSLSPHPCLECS